MKVTLAAINADVGSISEQSFSEPAMLPYSDLEYRGNKTRLDALVAKYAVRNPEE